MSTYSEKSVFSDSTINSLLDRIYYEVAKEFPEIKLDEALGLTGAAAAIHQGKQSGNCKNVMLVTNSTDLYLFFQNVLPKKLKNSGVLKFRERTIYYFGELALEIWFEDGTLGIIQSNGIDVQEYNKINPLCL